MKKLDLSKSVYSSSRYNGLSVKNGRLINNRPDSQTGIAQACEIRKSIQKMDKVSMIAKGVAMGNMMDEMIGFD
jgi:hypothetical protein